MTDTRTEVQKAYDDTKPYLEGEKLISADALIKTFKRVFSALFSLQQTWIGVWTAFRWLMAWMPSDLIHLFGLKCHNIYYSLCFLCSLRQ